MVAFCLCVIWNHIFVGVKKLGYMMCLEFLRFHQQSTYGLADESFLIVLLDLDVFVLFDEL